jgi:hypothetical protein
MRSLNAVPSLDATSNLSATPRLNMSLHMRNRTHVLAHALKPNHAPSLNTPNLNIARSLHTPSEKSPNLRRTNASELTERRARTMSWRAGFASCAAVSSVRRRPTAVLFRRVGGGVQLVTS